MDFFIHRGSWNQSHTSTEGKLYCFFEVKVLLFLSKKLFFSLLLNSFTMFAKLWLFLYILLKILCVLKLWFNIFHQLLKIISSHITTTPSSLFFTYAISFTTSCTFLCSFLHFPSICLLVLETQKFLLIYILQVTESLFSCTESDIKSMHWIYFATAFVLKFPVDSFFFFYNCWLSEKAAALVI